MKLYKLDSNGRLRSWKIEQEGDRYRTIAGLEDGEKVTSEWTVAVGKNIGKANETTGEQQAASEVESLIKKKLEQGGYVENFANINDETYFEPMLATSLDKIKKFSPFGVFSQPKLDGQRLLARKSGLFSRQGKPVTSVPHIQQALEELHRQFPGYVIDGELYNHDFKNDFNSIISITRKQKSEASDFARAEELIQYHIYDVYMDDKPNSVFSSRFQWLQDNLTGVSKCLKLVRTVEIHDHAELDAEYGVYLEQGYEGQMIRLNSAYENKRTKSLIKRKEFIDEEFTVLDILPGVGNWSSAAKRVIGRLPDGVECGSSIRGTKEYLREVLENKHLYIGSQGTMRYQNRTPANEPRFPVTIALYGGQRDI